MMQEYVDKATGKRSDREQFQKMFGAASRRELNVLLFWSLDRLSREGTVQTLNHLERLTGYGIELRSFTERYLDSTGIFKQAVIGILAAVAKQERVRLSERTVAGLERARAQGRVGRTSQGPGRPHADAALPEARGRRKRCPRDRGRVGHLADDRTEARCGGIASPHRERVMAKARTSPVTCQKAAFLRCISHPTNRLGAMTRASDSSFWMPSALQRRAGSSSSLQRKIPRGGVASFQIRTA